MAKADSQDLRDRMLAAYDRGMPTKEIAKTFAVSPAWARCVKQRRRETGRTTPLARGGATLTKIDMHQLAEFVQQQPDATMLELRDRLGIDCTESAICVSLKRLGLTFKKRRCMLPSRIDRTSSRMASSTVREGCAPTDLHR